MPEINFDDILGIEKLADNLTAKQKIKNKYEGIGCALCDYSGYVKNINGKELMCSCQKEKIYKEIYDKANIPRIYLNNSLDDWNTRTDSQGRELGSEQKISETVYLILEFYVKNIISICNNRDIYIRHTGNIRTKLHSLKCEGRVGSGKTFIASVLCKSAIKKGLSAKYYDWSDLVSYLNDFEKKAELEQANEDFKNIDFIAIDGIEQCKYTHQMFNQNLDRLAKSRLNSGKPFVLLGSNIADASTGSGWASLLNRCFTVRLPHTK
jgi:DNA replication protein DnaC